MNMDELHERHLEIYKTQIEDRRADFLLCPTFENYESVKASMQEYQFWWMKSKADVAS